MQEYIATKEYKSNIPHKMPYMVQFAVANACNLKCEFCSNSLDSFVHAKPFMEYDMFCDLVDNIVESTKIVSDKPMVINLVGAGEPLLNKHIVDMVRYIKKKNASPFVIIITNATLLTEEISDGLIDAGLDYLRVSLNGLSDDDYLKYTGVKIDYEKLYKQVKYYYDHSKHGYVMLKTMKYMLHNKEKEDEFKRWKDCAHFVSAENVAEIPIDGIDFSRLRKGYENINMKGNKIADIPFCTFPFIQCSISEEGIVAGCCIAQLVSGKYPEELIIGDMKKNLFHEIWNGKKINSLRLSLIDKPVGVCAKCNHYKQFCNQDESLASERDRLREYLLKNI